MRCAVKTVIKIVAQRSALMVYHYGRMKCCCTHTSESVELTGRYSHTVNTSKPLWLAHTLAPAPVFLLCDPSGHGGHSFSGYLCNMPACICLYLPASSWFWHFAGLFFNRRTLTAQCFWRFTYANSQLLFGNYSDILLHKTLSNSLVSVSLCWFDCNFIDLAHLLVLLRLFPGGFNGEQ